MKKVEIYIEKGMMKVDFYEEDVLIVVGNFIKLVKLGFYDGFIFYCVILNFVIQGGCLEGIGRGGLGWIIQCELDGDN